MTQPPDEYGDVLRGVLRAEADTVVPSPEGLEIIRARIERRGMRNLFWWRAGAAAASAVLVAGTIVMVVPELRHQVLRDTVQDIKSTSTPPAADSTNRAVSPEPPIRSQPTEVVVVPDPSTRPPRQQPSETAKSTSKPTPSSTPCPTAAKQQDAQRDDCPTGTPTPTPTPTPTVTPTPTQPDPVPTCPADECPPPDPEPIPTAVPSPLLNGTPYSIP
ncbi:hypothetical protein AB0C18_41050 [Nonomuraea muscovyensis]|uniref:hypothetical protein n=1 Tax=Nonomuraea muscovyensis TaxID=1124761 RepID=UPI0033F64AF9|nr:hypothetical protein [Nonomuraea muscovyensis]